MMKSFKGSLLLILASTALLAQPPSENETGGSQAGTEEGEKTVKKGILSFPVSQQITPMISFGQNIIDKKQVQFFTLASKAVGRDEQYSISLVPNLIYALTDSFSIYFANQINVRNREGEFHSTGVGDSTIQLEYAFYTKAYKTFYDQATVVTNVTIPTGSSHKYPPTGFGANSFFIGGTYSRIGVNWYGFVSTGEIFISSSHQTQFGNQYLYQFGIGKRIMNTQEWLLCWLVEFDGIYACKDRIKGHKDPNSGGNTLLITPSLFLSSSESLVVQLGFGFPVCQQLNGTQNKNDYTLDLDLGWTF
jgi:hypothetical protein